MTMKDPFDRIEEESNAAKILSMSQFQPKKAPVPDEKAQKEIELAAARNGFTGDAIIEEPAAIPGPVAFHPQARERVKKVQWTVRTSAEVHEAIKAIGRSLNIRDNDVIPLLLNHYLESRGQQGSR